MAEVVSMFLSPFLQVFFERMASREFDGLFRERKLNDRLLNKLKIALSSVDAVVEDAEDKQFTDTSVKKWLDEMKDVIYYAEDILDEIDTKDLQLKLDSEFGTIASKVRHPITASLFVNKIEGEIKDAVDKLEDLANQKGALVLKPGTVGRNPSERPPTTSLVDESRIFGRHDDKDAIIKSLLLDNGSGNEMEVIAIIGMGGIGKTTLAQLVFNDDRLKGHFDHKAWVCVSDPFDVFQVTKAIVEKLGIKKTKDKDLDQLQSLLKDELMKKKFLLVLDDVWNRKRADWELLSKPFNSGAQRSRIIVTTRDEEVALVMFATETHRINKLSKEDCWSLFLKYAFHDGNSDAYPELEAIGRQIVEKCKGLPLAIKAIGALLWSKLGVDEWDKVLRSELWDLPIEETDILPALRLSYKYLSPHLKRCFAYCSIFPKDYKFEKDALVLLWMAEGFLPQPKNKTMEEVGDDYFFALVSRSLFQRSNDEKYTMHEKYVMHDIVNDLAKFISKKFIFSPEDVCSHEIPSKSTRHFSYSCKNIDIKKFAAFHEDKRLHTVLELNPDRILILSEKQFLLPMIKTLRVLIISHHANIAKLPYSIGKLIHLRYLNISCTWIERLPDSICKLCNLQILNLSSCWNLVALPKDMHKLVNLRHLDISGTNNMKEMPRYLGRLKCLQTLTKFIVGKHSGFGIEELGKLTNLRDGTLSILNLQNVGSPMDAKDAKYLRDRKYLKELVLEWKVDDTHALESHLIVLESLQPHSNLRSLFINGYGGKSFPDWVGHPSFSNIASLHLNNCKFCCSLPPLGQLPSLQDLSIVGLNGVVTVGHEFYGIGSSSMQPFGALKVISFKNMLNWEEWVSFDPGNECEAFPSLRNLIIHDCRNFASFLKEGLFAPNLEEFQITKCRSLQSLPDKMHILLPSLEELHIEDCPEVESFPEGGLPSNLNTISISNCDKLFARRMRWDLQNLPSVRRFQVVGQSEDVESFPDEGLLPATLSYLHIEGFPNLKSLDKKGLQHLTALEELKIWNCPKLQCMPEDGLPASLTTLNISSCPLLEKEWDRKTEEWRKIAHVRHKWVNGRLE